MQAFSTRSASPERKVNHYPIPLIVKHLKGFSSYYIRKHNTSIKKYKSFYSSSYFVESIGNISEKSIKKYIRNQKINLKSTYKYKKVVENYNKRKSIKEKQFKDKQFIFNNNNKITSFTYFNEDLNNKQNVYHASGKSKYRRNNRILDKNI